MALGRAPRTLLILIAAGAIAAALAGCTSGSALTHPSTTAASSPAALPTTTVSTVSSPPPSSSAAAAPTTTPPRRGSGAAVDVRLFEDDGQTFGVGMPIIAYFSRRITDASVFDKVVTVTVNGQPADGAWYWEWSSQSGDAMEAHYRTARYWPGHANIQVSMPVAGLWAGPGLVFADSLTLAMKTGAAHLVSINGLPGVDTMTITSDGAAVRTLRVSLGKSTTPTYEGTAVVMEKDNPQHMVSAPGESYYSIEVPWSVRVTYDGEFIHDAYWNGQIGQQNLSHGCTNLAPADAKWYYSWSLIGDPVTWSHTGTSAVVPVTDGWGDWNLPWASWQAGGLLAPAAA